MPEYRRSNLLGGTFFFTVVSYARLPIFASEPARALLRAAWRDVQERHPFTTLAVCLLPNHLHCIWSLPEGDSRTSLRWREIKRLFTIRYLKEIGPGAARPPSHVKRGEAAIWQRRFWEHVIVDEADLNRHLDYLHYNPVKHGLVHAPADWPWSSFQQYVRKGFYTPDWGASMEHEDDETNYGE